MRIAYVSERPARRLGTLEGHVQELPVQRRHAAAIGSPARSTKNATLVARRPESLHQVFLLLFEKFNPCVLGSLNRLASRRLGEDGPQSGDLLVGIVKLRLQSLDLRLQVARENTLRGTSLKQGPFLQLLRSTFQ